MSQFATFQASFGGECLRLEGTDAKLGVLRPREFRRLVFQPAKFNRDEKGNDLDNLRLRLDRSKAVVLVVDVQERMCAAMDQERVERLINRTRALLNGSAALGVPVFLTEQYPKGLGATIERVRSALPPDVRAFEKSQFSCALPALVDAFAGRMQVLLCGMEAHVCVFQTARDLLERGILPVLCADALLSRTEEDRHWGIERCRDLGAVVTTVEGALFDMLGCSGTPEFKRVSVAVK